MFSVTYDEEALQFLEKLEKDIRLRIFDKVAQAKENPLHFFERLTGCPEYKLRVGDYRVVADIDPSLQRIHVLYIGHRKNVYEK